jgi:hypothetical protein
MAETPEGPMPRKKKKSEVTELKPIPSMYFRTEYDLVVDLVRMVRDMGIPMRARCPRCGLDGSVSVVETKSGYRYLVIRHSDGGTHTVPKTELSSVLRDLCEVKKDLEYIVKRFKEYEEGAKVKVCVGSGQ